MITGAHTVIYSRNPEADRAFLRDVLGLPYADAGEGWLIFGLPPSEVAFHPHRRNNVHEFFFMCREVRRFVAAMKKRGVECGPIRSLGWGKLTEVMLPGGGRLGVYQPLHRRPKAKARPRQRRR
jgi:catechol 2,3-dioxygenase-like lactoylglutathione lyase family enzyme